MTTQTTPPPAPPDDGALNRLRARFYATVAETSDALHTAPGHVGLFLDDRGRRTATLNFDSIDEAGRWIDWLHWAHAIYLRDGRPQVAAYGQWHGFSCQIFGTDEASPAGRDSESAPVGPAVATTGQPGMTNEQRIDPDEPRDWIFTFGFDHRHPVTDERLHKRFVRIHDTCDGSRSRILAVFGNRWSFQYPSEDRAGVAKHGLTEIPLTGTTVEG